MVETIRVKARQTMVNYRTPTSFLIRETYPLPPYSAVVGMIHSVCGFERYHDMRISVQGSSRGITSDLFIRYAFGNMKYDSSRHQLKAPDGKGGWLGVSRGIAHAELLCDVELILHIQPKEDEDAQAILNGFENPCVYPSLGRYEDLLDVWECKTVQVHEESEAETSRDVYFPERLWGEDNGEVPGSIYLLHKQYEIDPKRKTRRWKNTVKTRFIGRGNFLYDVDVDEDGFPVAFDVESYE